MPIQLPSVPLPLQVKVRPLYFGGDMVPPLGGVAQRFLRLGSRFGVDVTLPAMIAPLANQWIAARAAADAAGSTVRMAWPQVAPGRSFGSPLVNGATQAGTSLITDGWGAPINLLLQSETLGVTWTLANATAAAEAASAGINLGPTNLIATPDLLTRTATAAANASQAIAKAASAIQYTFSLYVDRVAGNFFALGLFASAGQRADVCFNLANSSVSLAPAVTGAFAGVSARIDNMGNGSFRLSLTATTNTGTALSAFASPSTVSQKYDDTGSAVGAAAWVGGAQLEAGAAPTSYRRTTTGEICAGGGSFFSFQDAGGRNYIHCLTADAVKNASGQSTLAIGPMLRASPPDNAALAFDNPQIEGFIALSSAPWDRQRMAWDTMSFSLDEVA